ncbi:hypothetical protein KC19_5G079000 [Ceratodon purpureus]|uniref:tRNA ligase phosphodiesterase domain-containing protein n=1 Tax=Ceratodon purpureus TaxID=3225 RepID=A0A8T0I0H4_CERPU|nr:hypothetical protein KC19_5G079000 [Ceratodon purpureus]KAG0576429.1 hypothetical protein KC19_5G079000 [Ceratodon purpureus]KAG0576430.1 hypothetical protein KC19_5G079000 [Ceratodon purpureus]
MFANLRRPIALIISSASIAQPRFRVAFRSSLRLLSSTSEPLFSEPMPQGKHVKQQWVAKPKSEAAHEAGHDRSSSGSTHGSTAPGNKPAHPEEYRSPVDEHPDSHPEPIKHAADTSRSNSKGARVINAGLMATTTTPTMASAASAQLSLGQDDLADRVERMKIGSKEEEHQHQGKKKGKIKEDVVTPEKVKGTVADAQLRATFYPKFENEKSDQEVRIRMQEVVGAGHGVLEVTQKHSGSLFLYSGDNGGAFAKNSYGNLYTAVGVFVLGRTLQEAWGSQAGQKQREFNAYLKEHRICIGMELVTAVLGDHGQRPLQDYVVVTAVTKLVGRPHFMSTPEVVAFCHQWRLPTNHYWLFSTKASVTSFFTAYDALCEEGLAGTVTNVLNDIADTHLPATKRHEDIQGEILEGLVARIVTPESLTILKEVLVQYPPPPVPEIPFSGKDLREICSSHRDSENKQVAALLRAVGSDFCSDTEDWLEDKLIEQEGKTKTRTYPMLETLLHSTPANYSTKKLQEMIRVIHKSKLPVRFKCHKIMSSQSRNDQDNVVSQFKMTVHVLSDSAFRRYQKEMSKHASLWPLYRGFFVDVRVFNASNAPAMIDKKSLTDGNAEETRGSGECGQDDSVDESQNLMLKLKFLPYKIRTFLIRNGISALFDKGVAEYKEYYTRQMKIWGTSPEKQMELTKLLNEWAGYIKKRMNGKKLSSNTYLTEAEPFLKQFAERSLKNKKLVGAAGVDIDVDDFLAIQQGGEDEYISEGEHAPSAATPAPAAPAIKAQGMLVFFPGIPGCAKSALCKAIMTSTHELPTHSLMGDMIKGKYWPKLNDERAKKPHRITFADKNAPNKEVWQTVQKICNTTRAIGVPVVPESEGTGLNPFSLDVLAVFIYRVLQRTNHPGKLDKNTPNPGYVLLMFYNLYDGMDRKEFEEELTSQFGHIVKIPVLKLNRSPMPRAVLNFLEEGLDLYNRHTRKHGRLESLHGSFKDEWMEWERGLRKIMVEHKEYLLEVQVPFQEVVETVQQQLKAITSGDFVMHVPVHKEERSFQTIRFVAIALDSDQVVDVLQKASIHNPQVGSALSNKDLKGSIGQAHITLAHKASHGGAAVAAYAPQRGCETEVQLTALLFSEKLVAVEVQLAASGEKAVVSKNEWPHLTVWTAPGMKAKDANRLPQMAESGEATRVELQPATLSGHINFY